MDRTATHYAVWHRPNIDHEPVLFLRGMGYDDSGRLVLALRERLRPGEWFWREPDEDSGGGVSGGTMAPKASGPTTRTPEPLNCSWCWYELPEHEPGCPYTESATRS